MQIDLATTTTVTIVSNHHLGHICVSLSQGSGMEDGVKVVEMLMIVEWHMVVARGKWWWQVVVSECLGVCVCKRERDT
ncbi:hypothetical protein Hanom_Chr06g00502261 [Helianthus anomalus]